MRSPHYLNFGGDMPSMKAIVGSPANAQAIGTEALKLKLAQEKAAKEKGDK